MKQIGIINGPNLGRLGQRQPEIYGTDSLDQLNARLTRLFPGIRLRFYQSNHEGALIDQLELWKDSGIDGVVINAGALTHQSYALRDAVAASDIPTVEVHISNIYSREPFRAHSLLAPVVKGQITGLGLLGYQLAVQYLADFIEG